MAYYESCESITYALVGIYLLSHICIYVRQASANLHPRANCKVKMPVGSFSP